MTSTNPEYYREYYLNNKEKMIASARESYERRKDEMAFCDVCEKSVKKMGYNQHCLSKKHIRNLENIASSSSQSGEPTSPLTAPSEEELSCEGEEKEGEEEEEEEEASQVSNEVETQSSEEEEEVKGYRFFCLNVNISIPFNN